MGTLCSVLLYEKLDSKNPNFKSKNWVTNYQSENIQNTVQNILKCFNRYILLQRLFVKCY